MTKRDLPETPDTNMCLFCPSCEEHYSCNRGDYWWLPLHTELRCHEDDTPLVLVTTHTVIRSAS